MTAEARLSRTFGEMILSPRVCAAGPFEPLIGFSGPATASTMRSHDTTLNRSSTIIFAACASTAGEKLPRADWRCSGYGADFSRVGRGPIRLVSGSTWPAIGAALVSTSRFH